jgi:cytoplasmic polyadenylation element-binding protein
MSGQLHLKFNQVEIKPYVVNDQMCDNCQGKLCQDRYAPYFCGDVSCLEYYCEVCWDRLHYSGVNRQRESHKPFVRMGEQTKVRSAV